MSEKSGKKVVNVDIEEHKGSFWGEYEATVTLDDGTTRSAFASSKEKAVEKATDKAQRKSWF